VGRHHGTCVPAHLPPPPPPAGSAQVRTFRSVGRAFIHTPRVDLTAQLTDKAARLDRKLHVCAETLAHLAVAEEEADKAFLEVTAGIQKRLGGGR
jgi:chaperonin cofactor prefoldin